MATSKTPTTRSRTTTAAKRAPRKRANSTASQTRAQSLTADAKTAVRSARTRATRVAKAVPTDVKTVSIVAGVLAGFVAAGVAIFMNRDKLRDVATTGGEKLKKAADDLSTIAHERIDQARDNITKFRARNSETPAVPAAADSLAITG